MLKKILIWIVVFLACVNLYARDLNIIPVPNVVRSKNQITIQIQSPKLMHSKHSITNPVMDHVGTQINVMSGFIPGGDLDSFHDMWNELYAKYSVVFGGDFYFYVELHGHINETGLRFKVSALFDPLDETANEIAKKFIINIEGTEYYGAKFHTQTAKAMILFLTSTIGKKQGDYLIPYDEQFVYHKFSSYYEADNLILGSMWENVQPTNADIFLPWIEKVFSDPLSATYGNSYTAEYALRRGDAVLIKEYYKILYGDSLDVFPTISYSMPSDCSESGRETCL